MKCENAYTFKLKNKMKNSLAFMMFLMVVFTLSCTSGKHAGGQQITLTNTANIKLSNKAITIKRAELSQLPAGDKFPLLLAEAGDTIPAQLNDLDGDQQWDELFFVTNLAANKATTIQLKWIDAPAIFTKRTNVRFGVRPVLDSKVSPADSATFYPDQLPGVIGYQHFQTDGPTWENDKVGFRLYFDGRNSVDVFGKKVAYMTPQNVGINAAGVTEANYSAMQDWGTDILAVGNSVGIGGISFMIGDSLARLGVTEKDSINNVDSTHFQIVANGPEKSIMKFTYNGWRPMNRDYFVQTTTSIWPGIYAFNNQVICKNLKDDETLLVGLVNSNTDHAVTEMNINDKWVALFTHDKQAVDKQWWLGLALVLPKDTYLGYIEAPKTGSLSTTFLGKLKIENNKPVNYFAIAAWELSDEQFKDSTYFKNYVSNFADQQAAEVTVTIE
ncbi:DUF4861 domain-containing protein [soil metagenome]